MTRWLAFLAVAFTFAGALAPVAPDAMPLGDKALHVIVFAALGFLFRRAGLRTLWALLALACFSVAIEFAQGLLTAQRAPSLVDAAASLFGGALGVGAARVRGRVALAATACACVAAGISVDLSVTALRRPVMHALLERAWASAALPWPGAPARAALRISAAGQEVIVVDSVGRRALAIAPGLWPGVRPGVAGTTIILGHRNGAFRMLGDLKLGDAVVVSAPDGARWRYRVIEARVVRWDRSGVRPHAPGQSLALVTCWPIGAHAKTPWRLVVRAVPDVTTS